MCNKIQSPENRKFIHANLLFKHMSFGLRVCGVYFPHGPRRRCAYWAFFLVMCCLDALWILRHYYVVSGASSTGRIVSSAGILTYYIGVAYMMLASCYSITKYFPVFVKLVDDYRLHFGEFNYIGLLRKWLKLCSLTFYIATPIMVVVTQIGFFAMHDWKGLEFLFWPFPMDTFFQRVLYVVYGTPNSMRFGGFLFLIIVLFWTVSFVIKSESDIIEKEMKRLILGESNEESGMIQVKVAREDVPVDTNSGTYRGIATDKNVAMGKVCDSGIEVTLRGPGMETYRGANIDPRVDIGKRLHDTNTDCCVNQKTKKKKSIESRREYLKELNEDGTERLETLRHRYEALLDLVKTSNDVFNPFFLAAFATALPVLGFVLYGIIKSPDDKPMIQFLMIITMNISVAMCWILFVGAFISTKVVKPLDHVMKINTRNTSEKLLSTVSMWTTRIAAPPSAFTIFELMAIDTSTMLTILGTLLTYSLVIFQFAQNPEDSARIVAEKYLCNSTTV